MTKRPKPKFWTVDFKHPKYDDLDWGGYVFQDLYEDLTIVIDWCDNPMEAYQKNTPDLMDLGLSGAIRRKDFERIPDKQFEEVLYAVLTEPYAKLTPEIREKLKSYLKPKVDTGKWPTLEGRLKNAPTSEKQVIEQLAKIVPLSPHGQALLEKHQSEKNSTETDQTSK